MQADVELVVLMPCFLVNCTHQQILLSIAEPQGRQGHYSQTQNIDPLYYVLFRENIHFTFLTMRWRRYRGRPGGPWIWRYRLISVGIPHYDDVIMTTMAAQITSLTVVYSTVYSDANQRKYQSSALLAFVWGIYRDRWIPRTKGQLRGKCFHLMT